MLNAHIAYSIVIVAHEIYYIAHKIRKTILPIRFGN